MLSRDIPTIRERILPAFALILVLTAAALSAGLLLYASVCAFTHYKFGTSGDYIRYTNMIWNTGYGEWFRYWAGESSYLRTHLSFTLGLIGPLFRVWDDPFLLSVLQWVLILAGGGFLLMAGRRVGVPPLILGAVALFWVSYHFTQALQLCEFHSTVGYMFFLPWLYWTLCGARRWAWIPLVLLCGMREEAGLYALPLLIWFAWRERWRPGWWLAGAATLYVILATLWLFPLINDLPSIFSARKEIFEGVVEDEPRKWTGRATAVAWTLLPVLPFVRRRLLPFLILVPLPLLANLASRWPPQYTLGIHYAANVMAALAIAMLESAREQPPAVQRGIGWGTAAMLIAATALSYHVRGFLPGSRPERGRVYRNIRLEGLVLWRFVRHQVPREGILTSEKELLSMLANRRDLYYGRLRSPSQTRLPLSVAVCRRERLPQEYRELLHQGLWGVCFADARLLVLQRGAPTNRNADVLRDLDRRLAGFAYTRRQFGSEQLDPTRGPIRYWPGHPQAKRRPVSLGGEFDVDAGAHRFIVEYRTMPAPGAEERPGLFILNDTRAARHILTNTISRAIVGEWTTQAIDFTVPQATRIELQVMGGAAPLWLSRAECVPAP